MFVPVIMPSTNQKSTIMAETQNEKRSLFVTNLEEDVTDEILFELFLQAGPIESCTIKEKSRNMRVGIIVFKHETSVSYAKDIFKGTALYNKELVISSTDLMSYPLYYGQSTLRGEFPYIANNMGHMNHNPRDERNHRDEYRHHRPERSHHDRRYRPDPYESGYNSRHNDHHDRHNDHRRDHRRRRDY